ncbi:MAG: ribbon-helix-helix domain-containing protein [Alphaproteobacteria bacterium]|nr:ribbon-helix-helix domain-containing protein [Alphaproteobacteria bacterium]
MKKLSVNISGHLTSLSLENEFLIALKRIAAEQNRSVAEIIREIDAKREKNTNLSSAARIWILYQIVDRKYLL